jgi:hypothetical protein
MKEGPPNPNLNPDPVNQIIEELWLDRWDTPIRWSIDLAHLNCELGQVHKKRLSVFYDEIKDRGTYPLTTSK